MLSIERNLGIRFDRVWFWTISGTAAVLLILWIVMVNRPPEVRPPAEQAFQATTGQVLGGTYTIAAGEYLAARMDFNHKVTFAGGFRTSGLSKRVSCLVVSAEEFERWKAGQSYQRLAETGYVPGGKISVVIGPGTYYVVIDNRTGTEARRVNAFFDVY